MKDEAMYFSFQIKLGPAIDKLFSCSSAARRIAGHYDSEAHCFGSRVKFTYSAIRYHVGDKNNLY